MCFSRTSKAIEFEYVLKQLSGFCGAHPETDLTNANGLVISITLFTFLHINFITDELSSEYIAQSTDMKGTNS
jgi:hypothetical protein